jgi:hypothetical protein
MYDRIDDDDRWTDLEEWENEAAIRDGEHDLRSYYEAEAEREREENRKITENGEMRN